MKEEETPEEDAREESEEESSSESSSEDRMLPSKRLRGRPLRSSHKPVVAPKTVTTRRRGKNDDDSEPFEGILLFKT